ncbi:MAG TPA: hypothetical protein VNO55_20420, partial [Polyangia bacterium]|nr:hypothetical protein [Polyangia bacterium]
MASSEPSQGHLDRGRQEYQRHDWAAAYASLMAADQTVPLGVEDLERMAFAAELSGDSEAFLKTTERIYEVRLAEGASRAAARAAFWVGFRAMA